MKILKYVKYVIENIYYNFYYRTKFGGDLPLTYACSWRSFVHILELEKKINNG